MTAFIKTADLPILSPNLSPPKPPHRKNENGEEIQACVSLSAGICTTMIHFFPNSYGIVHTLSSSKMKTNFIKLNK